MWRLIILSVVQSALLAGGQVFLKFGLSKLAPFGFNRAFLWSLLPNWQFALSGLLFGGSTVLWMYIVKRYPLSMAYPMISLSYVFALLSAMVFFHESVNGMKWIGVALIMLGCFFIAR